MVVLVLPDECSCFLSSWGRPHLVLPALRAQERDEHALYAHLLRHDFRDLLGRPADDDDDDDDLLVVVSERDMSSPRFMPPYFAGWSKESSKLYPRFSSAEEILTRHRGRKHPQHVSRQKTKQHAAAECSTRTALARTKITTVRRYAVLRTCWESVCLLRYLQSL